MAKKGRVRKKSLSGNDSQTEDYFQAWLVELKRAGYIGKWQRASSYQLCPSIKIQDDFKTRKMQKMSYQPDFEVEWKRKPPECIVQEIAIQNGKSLIEVKGPKDFHGNHQTSMMRIKILYQAQGYLCTMVKVPDIFKATFTPLQYLFTTKHRPRKLDYQAITLDELLQK